MPLEIRQQIYRFCIPQNLDFNCSLDLYYQHRNSYDDDSVGVFSTDEDGNEEDDDDSVGVFSTDEDGNEEEGDKCSMFLGYRAGSRRSALPGLLLVCRQMTDEVTAMLYGGNTFKVDVHRDNHWALARLSRPAARGQLRKMLLVFRPMGVSYRPGFVMDPTVWDGVLGRLSSLWIVAAQPEPSSPSQHGHGHEHGQERLQAGPADDAFEAWTRWLTPNLEYLGRALPGTAQIVVDANEEGDTVRMVERVLPGRCRFQQLRAADFIFQRGESSPTSGYWDDDDDDYDDGPTSCRDIISDWDYDQYYSD
ncbi:hypothetical protein SPI_06313 [Niveomyces insectorum RCEF 264]|uniref:DUF7730 domain-containing protein n=1 Tax=Niveomyces insectorum RCEF 264 TaxID=1081102 RepID=A0A167S0H5_9HYPO|nr:hypothetical protein SPI_06313 [Niveomyces insectorum RCEF 264]